MPRFGQNGMFVLNVAEKNDAAKCLSQIMSSGHSNRREGLSKFNKIYEFGYNLFNCNCNMLMTSVSGHLLDVDFSGSYKKWNQCPPVALFEAPITRYVPDNFANIKKTLEREVRKCQVLIIWTDGDREGENIGFEIIEVCSQAKPNVKVYRAKFSEITPRAVHQACANLVSPDTKVSNAVEVRRELDLRIGAAFTRFQTMRLQKRFPEALADQLISYGSCQFPTLGFVVERYKQAQEFEPEIFYKIKVTHSKDDCVANFNWKRGRVFNQNVCMILCVMCQENSQATVVCVNSKPKSKWRPLPLDTVELEKSASRKLKINAKETMKVAEKLYTQGIISYPRTETNIFPKGIDLAALVQNQRQAPQWGGFASRLLENGRPNPRPGKKSDNAHPPIHPLKYVDNLQGNEKRIYEFIVRHFLACVSQDAQGYETSIEIDICEERFSVEGLVITAKNYLDVYPYEQWKNKNIPHYGQGEVFLPDSIDMVDGETSSPSLLTEADLITLMEKHGIGTDATHADHIETIKNRNYVGTQQDGTFLPGQLGMALVEGYDAMGFAMSKPHLRAKLESDLVCVCQGTKDHKAVLEEQIRNYRRVFEQAAVQVEKLDDALSQYFGAAQEINGEGNDQQFEQVRKCPKCQQCAMVLRKTSKGSWMLGCMGYPQCRNSIFFPDFVLAVSRSDVICRVCQPAAVHKLDFQFRRGSMPPTIGERYVGCVGGCDNLLLGALNTNEMRSAGNPPRSAHTGSRNPTSNAGATRVDNSGSRNSGGNKRNVKTKSNSGVFPSASSETRDETRESRANAVVCNCTKPALELTVKKTGPNKGRKFYKCGSGENQCDFFLWCDAQPAATTSSNSIQTSNSSSGPSNAVNCNCAQPSIIRSVLKDGPNKGRRFYCCSKPRDSQCSFFQWADEEATGSKKGGGSTKQPTKKRKCGGCGQEGHTKRTCPFMK